jgi:hypothetical protein
LAAGASALAGHPEALRAFVRVGRPERGMPAFDSLPEDRLQPLLAHVATLASAADVSSLPTEGPPWITGLRRAALPEADPKGPPILAERSALQCGRCHPAETEAWRNSRHAAAMGPGVVGQFHGNEALRDRCDGCHAPLAEQAASKNLRLAAEGITCAACHLDAEGNKVAGPRALHSRQPSAGISVRRDVRLWRSDFCMPCHQLPAREGEGAPLLDTWREWAASPYLPADLQCQHCHLAGADHRMLGVHDAETVRRAVVLAAQVAVVEGIIEATASLHNVGAGHHFPTTATPRAVLRIRQMAGTSPLETTSASWAIGRTLARQADAQGRLQTEADTRIPAGETTTRRYRWRRHPQATAVEVSLWMFPDWHYQRVFAEAVQRPLSAEAGVDLGHAAQAAAESGFEVFREVRPLRASDALQGPAAESPKPSDHPRWQPASPAAP